MSSPNLPRLRKVITLIALALALAHLLLPSLTIDHITLILLSFALITMANSIGEVAGGSRRVEDRVAR